MDELNLLDESSLETGTTVSVHAGFPNAAGERGKTPLSLDRLLVRSPTSTYFFRVRGHSWHRQGVYDGDIAIIDRARTPTLGATVIYWTDSGDFMLDSWSSHLRQNFWGVVTAIIHQY
jgi:SOS-response transcriptional repressor LexA